MFKKFNNLLKKNKKGQEDEKFTEKLKNGEIFNENKMKDYNKDQLIIAFKQYVTEFNKQIEMIAQMTAQGIEFEYQVNTKTKENKQLNEELATFKQHSEHQQQQIAKMMTDHEITLKLMKQGYQSKIIQLYYELDIIKIQRLYSG